MNDPYPKFTAALRELYVRAAHEANYRAPYLLRMLDEMNGHDAATNLILSRELPVGFTQLYERKRLDLSIEALVLRPKWKQLFDRNTLAAARQRLESVHYRFAHDDWDEKQQDAPPESPSAADIADTPPGRVRTTTYRILRDTALARRVKQLNNHECQICGHTITLQDGSHYAEAHHIQPLGDPHHGPDIMANILCVCPNHHAELDYLIISLDFNTITCVEGHNVEQKYLDYHNKSKTEYSEK
jgi:hypothetical protein